MHATGWKRYIAKITFEDIYYYLYELPGSAITTYLSKVPNELEPLEGHSHGFRVFISAVSGHGGQVRHEEIGFLEIIKQNYLIVSN